MTGGGTVGSSPANGPMSRRCSLARTLIFSVILTYLTVFVVCRTVDILNTPLEQRLSSQDEGSNSGATMAIQDDAKWEGGEFQMDRFGLDVKETDSVGLSRAGSKLVNMISGSKEYKKDNQCQVSGQDLALSAF